MNVWDDLVGQEQVVAELQRAVADPAAMTHAWLMTGPPGSGRSNAARAFAAALECPDGGCGHCRECRTALAGSHADVTLLATEGLSIKVGQARELVDLAAHRPSVGPWRVIVVEDADRLTEPAADALLKVLEEPVSRTVWVLCAPSLEDVIITIRSRSRQVRLRTPPVDAVAGLLVRRDGVDPTMAGFAARAAQSHIGLARRLARDDNARHRREQVLALATGIHGLGDAIQAAADLIDVAGREGAAAAEQRNGVERIKLMEQLGADPSARTQPPHVRSQLAALEREQRARATRVGRDVVDRALTDLLSVYRDALVVHAGAAVPLVNAAGVGTLLLEPGPAAGRETGCGAQLLADLVGRATPTELLECIEAIELARQRIEANAAPLLALEAMTILLQLPR